MTSPTRRAVIRQYSARGAFLAAALVLGAILLDLLFAIPLPGVPSLENLLFVASTAVVFSFVDKGGVGEYFLGAYLALGILAFAFGRRVPRLKKGFIVSLVVAALCGVAIFALVGILIEKEISTAVLVGGLILTLDHVRRPSDPAPQLYRRRLTPILVIPVFVAVSAVAAVYAFSVLISMPENYPTQRLLAALARRNYAYLVGAYIALEVLIFLVMSAVIYRVGRRNIGWVRVAVGGAAAMGILLVAQFWMERPVLPASSLPVVVLSLIGWEAVLRASPTKDTEGHWRYSALLTWMCFFGFFAGQTMVHAYMFRIYAPADLDHPALKFVADVPRAFRVVYASDNDRLMMVQRGLQSLVLIDPKDPGRRIKVDYGPLEDDRWNPGDPILAGLPEDMIYVPSQHRF
ncbi:hypothetical protein KDL45_17680, partial [bacterium]|nr:hypothetical protein [bacterium]